jgi:MFS family permease
MAIFQSLLKHRAAIGVSACVNIGSVLFGFDTGVAGGVVALSSFKEEFNLASSAADYAAASSNIIALLNAGAFFGTFLPPVLSRYVGRRYLLAIAGFFFLIGGALQTAASGTLALIYAGRVVAGLGVGMISGVAPVFVAEAAPKHLRGMMVRDEAPRSLHGRCGYLRAPILTVSCSDCFLAQMSLFEMFLVSGGMLA